MALNLSKAERDRLRNDLKKAEPYEEDAPILCTFDGKDMDFDRWCATIAKKFLVQDEREKRSAGLPLEPETTPESERRKKASAADG